MRVSDVARVLESVVDPELGIGIVELGLIYGIAVGPAGVRVEMTTTTIGCPMSSLLMDAAEAAILARAEAASVEVVHVTEPPWDPAMLSRVARRTLGLPES